MRNSIVFLLIIVLISACSYRSKNKALTEGYNIPQGISDEAKALYEQRANMGRRNVDLLNPIVLKKARKHIDKRMLFAAKKSNPGVTAEEVIIDGVKAFWIRVPETKDDGNVILHAHGGAYVVGTAESIGTTSRIATTTGMPILSVEYGLAPENPFPKGLNDMKKAYRWLIKNGYDNSHIFVYGESSGGGLILATVLSLRDDGDPLPAAVAAMSPWADLAGTGDTYTTLATYDLLLSWDMVKPAAKAYIGDNDPQNPLISPLFGDYKMFPPLLLQVGTRDILLSDSVRLARTVRKADVDVTLDVWNGMWHVWQGVPGIPESNQATLEIARFFERYLK